MLNGMLPIVCHLGGLVVPPLCARPIHQSRPICALPLSLQSLIGALHWIVGGGVMSFKWPEHLVKPARIFCRIDA